jgi:predicted Holliday junction resolvase-like endonuclease
MTKLLIYGFLIYLLYKLIFNVVLPVRKGVKSVRQNMEEMQRKMAEAQQQNANYSGFTNQNPPKATPKSSNESVKKDADYIDFEEVK